MFVELTTKKGAFGINVDKILFACENGKYTRIALEDGTLIDVYESLDEVCSKCDVKISKENDKIKNLG